MLDNSNAWKGRDFGRVRAAALPKYLCAFRQLVHPFIKGTPGRILAVAELNIGIGSRIAVRGEGSFQRIPDKEDARHAGDIESTYGMIGISHGTKVVFGSALEMIQGISDGRAHDLGDPRESDLSCRGHNEPVGIVQWSLGRRSRIERDTAWDGCRGLRVVLLLAFNVRKKLLEIRGGHVDVDSSQESA